MKTLTEELRQELKDFLLEEAYSAAMDDAHHFIADTLRDGYSFVGYSNMGDEELVTELSEVDWEAPELADSDGYKLWRRVSAHWEAQ